MCIIYVLKGGIVGMKLQNHDFLMPYVLLVLLLFLLTIVIEMFYSVVVGDRTVLERNGKQNFPSVWAI